MEALWTILGLQDLEYLSEKHLNNILRLNLVGKRRVAKMADFEHLVIKKFAIQ